MFQVRHTHVRSRPVLGAVRCFVILPLVGLCLGGSRLHAQETDIPPPNAVPPVVAPPSAAPPVVAPPVIPAPEAPAGGLIRIQTDTPPVPPPGDAGLPPVLEEPEEPEPFPVPEQGTLIEAVDLPPSEVNLIIGRSQLFRLTRPLSTDTLISYDNDGVIEVQPLTDPEALDLRFLNVIGVGFGRATVRLIDQERNLVQTLEAVVSIDESALEERINTILEGSDITVRQVAQNVILEGQVANSKVMADVLELVRSELRLSGQAAVGSVASDLGFSAEEPALGTPVPPAAASPSGVQPGLVVVNRVKVRGPRQVMLKVKIAEINRTGLRQLGVNFQRMTDGTDINSVVGGVAGVTQFQPLLGIEQMLFADPLDTQLFGIFNDGDFRLYLNALRQNDLVRILAQPTLMTLDGQPARFLAGGSFPFPVPQIGIGGVATITIEFRDFGALLEFLPTIMEDDSIRLDVQPIFSELNQNTGIAVAGTAVPGLTERSARTVVQLREGQTLAIAGLFSTRTNGSTQRVPLLGDLPVLGPLFSRNVIQTNETELIVLVTPELVEPIDGQAAPGPGELYQEPNDLEFYFLGRLEGKTRHPHRSTTSYLDPFQVMKHFQSEDQWVVGPHGFAD